MLLYTLVNDKIPRTENEIFEDTSRLTAMVFKSDEQLIASSESRPQQFLCSCVKLTRCPNLSRGMERDSHGPWRINSGSGREITLDLET